MVGAIILPIVAGFALGGPGLGPGIGLAAGALVAVVIVVVAVRMAPRGPISSPLAVDARRHLLVVISRAVDDPDAVHAIAREAWGEGADGVAEVLVLAPARTRFLDRWASDVEGARRRAQRNLVITVASLAKADVTAQARVGDEELVQAVEDQLRTFPATDVMLVTGDAAADPAGLDAARELSARLRPAFRHIELGAG